ncbi:probable mitochondrial-processing peptidase subunit beta, mitochondrial [Phragmites australis]|uniref:probable mitochondrial-processing peptidase subunit beta, mitochondrial n=1 Tax=Phragmites australis TaxID=29695 RepID=UPI002D79A619|nr:probable mitochondrial-processing peptidase subunit beta, mitochondrial [Phragmites australis]
MAATAARSRRRVLPYLHRLLHSGSAPAASPSPSRFLRHASQVPRAADHSPFLRLPAAHVSTLPTGLRVVTQAYPAATRMASVGVWVDAGSRFELSGTNGTAHFLEHMAFKGTARRPDAYALEVEIEDMGARLNAYTSREQTTFFADVQARHVPAALDVLSDILQHPRFPEKAIQRERGVILREMEEVQGMMEEVIFDHLHAAAFRDHPLGDTILGPEENIKSILKKDLKQYISTHYTCPRMVVSAAGAVNHDEVVDQVKELFTGFSTDPTTADQLVEANPAIFTGSEVRVENAEMPLAHLAIAFKGSSWTDPSSIPLMVIQSILGSWNRSIGVGNCSGSALARGVSNGNLAESLMAFNTNYRDTGIFGIYTTAPSDTLHELSRLIMAEFRRLAFEVSETEVARARNQLKSALLLHIDGSTAVAENNGRQMLTYGRVMPFLELFARIDAVDCATIMETAKEYITDKDIALAAVGPLSNLPELSWFRSETCSDKEFTRRIFFQNAQNN